MNTLYGKIDFILNSIFKMYSSKQLKKWFRKIDGEKLIFGHHYLIGSKIGTYIHLKPVRTDYYYYFKLASHYNEYVHCYEWIPKNYQWQMERRSVNMIVSKLIGDENFEW